uniref:Reverse transcriptase domain-containing protein n=1 Tax=Anopheles minimus TaxID=112268 RepID=A0A182W923_9DIPT
MQAYPSVFQAILQNTLSSGQFPSIWKRQKLVLIPKPGKPPGDPSALRPLGLVDNLAKVQEMPILDRLTTYTEGQDGLSERQFGFRKNRSTVDAILAIT